LAGWLPVWTNTFSGQLIFTAQRRPGAFKIFYRALLP